MQNPIGEADLEWILHRNCEGTEQLRFNNIKLGVQYGTGKMGIFFFKKIPL